MTAAARRPARPHPGRGAPAPGEQGGAARIELLIARAVVLFHAGGLIQVAAAIALAWPQYPAKAGIVILAVALLAENAALIVACLRWRAVRPWLISLDVAFCSAALFACAGKTTSASGHTWADFMYPFTIITCLGIGAAYRRVPAVLAATAVLAGSYALSAVYLHHDPWWNTIPNSVTYFANTLVAWAVTRELRRGGRLLDASRAEAIARTEETARERERLRHARMLHDRVLQTLEVLASGPWLAGSDLHGHVAAEAAWLRELVQGGAPDQPGDLLAGLRDLVQQKAAAGLTVHLTCARLAERGATRIPPRTAVAVVAAAAEALTNVGKHAGVRTAVLRAALTEAGLEVSITDQGAGFDPVTARPGIGLTQSIGERVREVGGHVCLDSRPGEGTCVEITVPATALAQPGLSGATADPRAS